MGRSYEPAVVACAGGRCSAGEVAPLHLRLGQPGAPDLEHPHRHVHHRPLAGPLAELLDRLAAHPVAEDDRDRKSTRLNSSHVAISYAVFCLKKKRKQATPRTRPPEAHTTA